MKKIVTIQDISCLGKCSLTVALPIISACGVETCSIPTASLSTHTMFSGFTFTDLTDTMRPIKDHWVKEGFKFEAIYTGYLGSFEQIDIVKEYFETYSKTGAISIVDPVMADNGKLYPAFDMAFVKKMATLCAVSDIIMPNLTEATFMLDKEYIPFGYTEEYIKDILVSLTNLGAKIAILTGVSFEKDKIGIMGYDSIKKEFFSYYNKKIDAMYHGTGDIFASTFVGAYIRGLDILKSLSIAADYTAKCIEITKNDKNADTYGVQFELVLPELIKLLENV